MVTDTVPRRNLWHRLLRLAALAPTLTLLAPTAQAQVRIELQPRFVQDLRNRVVAYYDFDVIGPQTTPRAPANDAEVHLSGLAYKLPSEPGPATPYGFATVAEIMNAARFTGPGGLLNWIAAQVGGPLAKEIRLAVTGGSLPDAAIRATALWSTIRLVGFPRIDLEQVNRAIQGGALSQGKLSYEIVITSLLP